VQEDANDLNLAMRQLPMNIQNLRRSNGTRMLSTLLLVVVGLSGCGTPLPDPAVRTIAFGDSTTANLAERQYWEILRDNLGQPADSYAGQGEGGEPTAEGLERLGDLLDNEIYPNAEVLLYWQGGKDVLEFVQSRDPLLLLSPNAVDYPFAAALETTLDTTQANIEQAIALGRRAGLDVYVSTYYYFNTQTGQCRPTVLGVLLPDQQARVTQYIQLLNERIRQAAANAGAVLVDVGAQAETIVADPANYTDCNHLSEKGNQIVAGIFETAIRSQP
jgi:hypothetical protein